MDGLDDVYKLQRFVPTPQEAVDYFLRRLLTGEPLHGAEKLIHHADVYACEPKDLAKEFAPVPTAVSSGDRFFFTTLRRGKNGWFARVAGAGTWMIQTNEDIIDDEGVKVGEFRKLSFKKGKGKASTGWVMKEYRCLLPEAVVADGEMVLCKIHLAPHPPAAARQESDAYKLRRQEGAEPAAAPQPAEPVTFTASAHAQKRPAPVADADVSSCKKMRIAAPVPVPEPEGEYEDYPIWCTPSAPVSTEVPTAAEADDNTGCPWEDIFGEEQQESTQAPPIEDEVGNIQPSVSDQQESTQALTIEAEVDNIQQSVFDQVLEQPFEWEPLDEGFEGFDIDELLEMLAETDREMKKSCNHNADLQGQQNHFFSSFAPVN